MSKTVKCIDCHYLNLTNLQESPLPRESRQQIRAWKYNISNWLACYLQRSEFSGAKVLEANKCEAYVKYDPSLNLDQMTIRQAQKLPKWRIVLEVIGAVGVIVGIWQLVMRLA